MNKKLKFFLPLMLLLSGVSRNLEAHSDCDTSCEPVNQFCGGYVGANFNFGSVNFLSQSNTFDEQDVTFNGDMGTVSRAFQNNVQGCGLREAINAVGGGVSLGWNWSNSCWYLAAEFNGIFYGNPCSSLNKGCDDSCNSDCDTKCCNQFSLNIDDNMSTQGVMDDMVMWRPNQQYIHGYKNNVRLDGVVKLGLMLSPCSAVYLLGGGSGLLVKYNQSILTTIQSDSMYVLQNNPNNSFCCNKWIGGGTLGFGLKNSFSDCFDLTVEARYARYQNWCNLINQNNEVGSDFTAPYGDVSVRSQSNVRTDSYLGLIGLNWRF